MGNILEKLGIYDLFVIFLSGAIITYITSLVCEKFFINKFPVSVDETISFLILSFFVGTIFQEIGSLIFRKTFNVNKEILKAIFINSDDKSTALIKQERDGIEKYFIEKEMDYKDKEMIYNYCKYKLLEAGVSVNGDNNQSISGLSRSLALYFGILGFIFFICSCVNMIFFLYLIICTLLCIIFLTRCIRFIKIRYVFIFRSFYYKYIGN